MVEGWLKCRLKNPVVFEYNVCWLKHLAKLLFTLVFEQSPDAENSLLKCMTEGMAMIINQVDVRDLDSNKLYLDILQSRSILHSAKATTKINVSCYTSFIVAPLLVCSASLQIDGNEVECNPDFMLYLVSSDHVSLVSPTLFSLVTVVEFQPERKGIEELLLNSFLQLQNVKTYNDRQLLRRELQTQSARTEEVERQLLQLIAHQESELIEDPKSIKSILTLNKAFEDAQER